ncbi:MAG: VacJ family lipoprotein, partial [Pseudomonadota bacterium]
MKKIAAILLAFSMASGSLAHADPTGEQSYLKSLLSAATGAAVTAVTQVWEEVEADSIGSTSEADPFEKYNRLMFRFNSVLDEKALKPVAENYKKYTPDLVQSGVSNFFSNLGEVGVLTNSLLQGKFDQALNDSTRLALNSIAGIGGVVDVATMLNYEKNHEDFGQTFGVWGVPEGPYIVLPVLGPRTMRSAVGTALDTYVQ